MTLFRQLSLERCNLDPSNLRSVFGKSDYRPSAILPFWCIHLAFWPLCSYFSGAWHCVLWLHIWSLDVLRFLLLPHSFFLFHCHLDIPVSPIFIIHSFFAKVNLDFCTLGCWMLAGLKVFSIYLYIGSFYFNSSVHQALHLNGWQSWLSFAASFKTADFSYLNVSLCVLAAAFWFCMSTYLGFPRKSHFHCLSCLRLVTFY